MKRLFVVSVCSMLVFSLWGCHATSLHLTHVLATIGFVGIVFAAFAPIPAYLHSCGKPHLRNSVLMIPLAFLIMVFVPVPFLVAARFHLPLQDGSLAAFDRFCRFDGAAVVQWASSDRLGKLLNNMYPVLFPYLAVSIIVPALLGRLEAKRAVAANLIALTAGLVIFLLVPAIGPWYGERFTGHRSQQEVQAQIEALRSASSYSFSLIQDGSAIVCCPSFHVIWAVLAAFGMWSFKRLRVVLVMLSAGIVLSTMTTGWHYLADVLAGLAVASGSIWLSIKVLRNPGMTNAPLRP